MKYEWIVEIDDDEGFHLEEAKWKEELVRCKDCQFNLLPPSSGNANCQILYGMTDQNGFCSCGKRREDAKID